jgi:hypothetical protein
MELCVLDYGCISNKWTVLHVQINSDYLRRENFMNGQLHATITSESTVNKQAHNLPDCGSSFKKVLQISKFIFVRTSPFLKALISECRSYINTLQFYNIYTAYIIFISGVKLS